mgnify:CR=1 FL=1
MPGRGDRSTRTRPTLAALLAALALGTAGAGAETGNLVTSGQFDSSAQVDLWTNVNGAYSTLGYSSVDARITNSCVRPVPIRPRWRWYSTRARSK